MKAIDYLVSLGACEGPGSAMQWVRSRPPERQTLAALWADCQRADWMLWLAGRQKNPDLAGIVAAAHACAQIAADYDDATADASACGARAAASTADYTDAYYTAGYSAAEAADAAAEADDAAAEAADAAAYSAAEAAAIAYFAVGPRARDQARADCAWLVRLLVRPPVMP